MDELEVGPFYNTINPKLQNLKPATKTFKYANVSKIELIPTWLLSKGTKPNQLVHHTLSQGLQQRPKFPN